MHTLYPVKSQIAQAIQTITFNLDGSLLVTLALGTVTKAPTGEGDATRDEFKPLHTNSFMVARNEIDAMAAKEPQKADETLQDFLYRTALRALQESGRAPL